MKTQAVIPVILSIVVIILVAVIEKQSKLFAVLIAVMPLGAPLALWIVYSSNAGDKIGAYTSDRLRGVGRWRNNFIFIEKHAGN